MQSIYTIGEALLDIIFKKKEAVASMPGGAMLNTSVSLGRLEYPVYLISEYAKDLTGNNINEFLINNNVRTDFIYRYDIGKTALALAFLDDKQEARYSFYKSYPEERLTLNIPEFKKNDILLFGSFYSLIDEVREKIITIVDAAKKNGCLIIYDPNIRAPHKKDIPRLRNGILENLQLSNIVRASHEDFKTIFKISNHKDAWELCKDYDINYLIYTISEKGVYVIGSEMERFYNSKQINPVSTIGAGDSFNAGMISAMFHMKEKYNWDKIIHAGIEFASNVCLSFENYISWDFAGKWVDKS